MNFFCSLLVALGVRHSSSFPSDLAQGAQLSLKWIASSLFTHPPTATMVGFDSCLKYGICEISYCLNNPCDIEREGSRSARDTPHVDAIVEV
jgi:hypothetical protein